MTRIAFFISETFQSLRRHPAMAFAATVCVAATLLVAGVIALAAVNFKYAVDTQMDRYRFHVWFNQEVTRAEAMDAFKRLRVMDGIADARFVPREEPWRKLWNEKPKLAKSLKENPYPDGVLVKAQRLADIPKFQAALKGWPEIKDDIQYSEEVSQKLEMVRNAINRLGPIIGLLLGILSLVIIHHTIELTLYARRKEIFIMAMVGATPGTIATPFLLEGIIYGIFGGGFAIGTLYLLYTNIAHQLLQKYDAHLLLNAEMMTKGMWYLLAAGAVLGLIGSTVSVAKYLHRPRSRVTNA